eukprot:TRINITY_DN8801_c0_g2_i1.p1 TRINITY_DN8801_c0_g2~~TRINITY_DN8801_c0_g2_i1.p1  ORF type:complete len:971 (+),score=320.13 TRINITY_DN8801_c0_g2_i1:317-3229(+)
MNTSPSNAGKLLPHQGGKVTSDWRPKVTKKGLGTFMGVYVPCLLSIIGAVLFLRLGWAVGQAGVMGTLAMFTIGGTMAILTDLSLSAMATNGRVAGGGTYYLLSRSIGPELGGAIGMVFAAANVCGVAFYLAGFTDVLGKQIGYDEGEGKWPKLAIGAGMLVVQSALCIFSSSLYSKSAFGILCCQVAAQLYGNLGLLFHDEFTWEYTSDVNSSLTLQLNFTGPSWHTLSNNLWPDFDENGSFSKVFGIVFPAMTGIMAGTNMSGVLKRPELAIPRGELSAISSALFFYVVMIISLGASCDRDALKNDYLVLSKVTWWPTGVIIGVMISTGSSALASIQSAARLLQALAEDDLFPALKVFKKMWRGEPALAIVVSSFFALCLLSIGSLNVLAPILTMFMLITYGTTNFATFLYTIAGAPNFRPRFRLFSWFTALVGGILCLGLMIYIQWMATLIAFVILSILTWYVSTRVDKADKDWGDVTQALIFHQVRKYLLRLGYAEHVKFWRARFLMLSNSPQSKVNLFEFMNDMKKGGLLIVGDVVVNKNETYNRGELSQLQARRRDWQEFISEAKIKAFIEVTMARTFRDGCRSLMMLAGLGGMKPNTVVIGVPSNTRVTKYDAKQASLNSVLGTKNDKGSRRTITKATNWNSTVPLQGDDEPLSSEDFVSALMDATEMDMNLVVNIGFEDLDLANIVQKKSKARRTLVGLFGRKDDSEIAGPRGTDAPRTTHEKLRIDVWECPWGSKEDMALAMQLADMLWKQDYWSNHTYIRVCSFVEDDDETLAATKVRYADLHGRIIRKMRVPATIQVWQLGQVSPGSWSKSMAVQASDAAKHLGSWEAMVAAAVVVMGSAAVDQSTSALLSPTARKRGSSVWSGDTAAQMQTMKANNANGMDCLIGHLPRAVQFSVLHTLIRQQQGMTAVTILPLPALPVGRVSPTVAESFVQDIRDLTRKLGPVLLISAATGVMTYEL